MCSEFVETFSYASTLVSQLYGSKAKPKHLFAVFEGALDLDETTAEMYTERMAVDKSSNGRVYAALISLAVLIVFIIFMRWLCRRMERKEAEKERKAQKREQEAMEAEEG